MTWYNKLQFAGMVLAVAGVAAEWHVGLWATLFFGATSLVSVIAGLVTTHRFGNAALRPALRWGLVAMVAYWLMLLTSVFYSSDIETAKNLLVLKATLVVFPLAVLLADTSWLSAKHLRILGYALTVTLFGSFLYYCGVAVGKMAGGASLASVTGINFDPRHHTYTALYLSAAMLFVYYELYNGWNTLPRWWRTLLLVAAPVFILYNILVNSRAGMLVMYAIELFCVLHFALSRCRWGKAVLLAVLLAGCTFGMEQAMPGYKNRISDTLDNVSGDVRFEIYSNNIDAAMESPIVGYGAGDYHERQEEQYAASEFKAGMDRGYNAHNQYIETVLSTGFIGLAVLLMWMLWPLWMAWRRGARGPEFWLVLMLTFSMALNFMFESILERQMGLLFVGALMPIMILVVNEKIRIKN